MKPTDGLLNQVRLLVGNPLRWEVDAAFPFFGNRIAIEDHGNQYHVPRQVAEIYNILSESRLSDEGKILALEKLVCSRPSKSSLQRLYNSIRQVIEENSGYPPRH